MENDDPTLPDTIDRMGQLASMIGGDPVATANQIREATSFDLSSLEKILIICVGLLFGLAAVLKQVRPVAQPFADAAAENMRNAPAQPAPQQRKD